MIDKKYMQDKEWIIKYNHTLDPSTVSSDNVYVIDREGNKYEAKIKLEGKNIKVTPVNYYPLGKTLYLHVTKYIKDFKGRSAGTSIRYGFTIGDIVLNTNKLGDYNNISVTKEWTVSFNQKIDNPSLLKIKVYDENCNEIAVSINITNDNYVKITPVKAYKRSMTYYLIIDKVSLVKGKKLALPFWIKFETE